MVAPDATPKKPTARQSAARVERLAHLLSLAAAEYCDAPTLAHWSPRAQMMLDGARVTLEDAARIMRSEVDRAEASK